MATYFEALQVLERYLDERGTGRKYHLFGKDAERQQIRQIRQIVQSYTGLDIKLESSKDTNYQIRPTQTSGPDFDTAAALSSEISPAAWEEIKTVAQMASGVTGKAPLKGATFSTSKSSPLTAEILIDFFYLSQSSKSITKADAVEWFGEAHADKITTASSPRVSVSSASAIDTTDSESETEVDFDYFAIGTSDAQQALFNYMKSHTVRDFFKHVDHDLPGYDERSLEGLLKNRALDIQIALSFATKTTESTYPEAKLVNTLFTSPIADVKYPYIMSTDSWMPEIEDIQGYFSEKGLSGSCIFEVKPDGKDPTDALLSNLRIDAAGNFLIHHGADNIRLSTLEKDDYPTATLTTIPAHATLDETAAGAGEPTVYIDKIHLKMCTGLLKLQDPRMLTALDEKWFEAPRHTSRYADPYKNLYTLAKLPLQLLQSKNAAWLNQLDPKALTPNILSLLHQLANRGTALTGLSTQWLTDDGLNTVLKLSNSILRNNYILQGLNHIGLYTLNSCAKHINAIINDGHNGRPLFECIGCDTFFKLYNLLDQLDCSDALKSNIPLYQALSTIEPQKITYELTQQIKYLFEDAQIFNRGALQVPCNTATLKIVIDAFISGSVPDQAKIDTYQDHELAYPQLKQTLIDNIEGAMCFSPVPASATKIKYAGTDQTWIGSHREERELADLEAACHDATKDALDKARGRSSSPKSYLTRSGRRAQQITGNPHIPEVPSR